jgi:hypothetical protein
MLANSLDPFAIGGRDEAQVVNDGSLDIYVQHEKPNIGTSNWLPAPAGSFSR